MADPGERLCLKLLYIQAFDLKMVRPSLPFTTMMMISRCAVTSACPLPLYAPVYVDLLSLCGVCVLVLAPDNLTTSSTGMHP